MAALNATHPTLLDVTKAMDPGGQIDAVAEILNQTNEMLDDMVMIEANGVTTHRTTVRTGLPTPTWRKLYGGIPNTKSTRAQVQDTIGNLEAMAEIDKDLADLNGNSAQFRLNESKAFIEAMSQTVAETTMSGDESINPEKFTGFEARFNDMSAENADNIIDAGGTGSDNASIWLIGWGPDTCHAIYPKGSTAGLQKFDLGEQLLDAPDGNGKYKAYVDHYKWQVGLSLRDWRYAVRICNIDKSLLTKDASSGADLHDLMFQAEERVPNLSGARFAYYMSRDIRTKVRQQATYGTENSTLTTENVGGKRITSKDGIPLKRVDNLSINEARIT